MNNIMMFIFLKKDDSFSRHISDIDLQALIDLEMRKYGDAYIGAYDFHVFKIDGKDYPIQSRLSYEEVWHLHNDVFQQPGAVWHMTKDPDVESWQAQKHIKMISLLTTTYINDKRKHALAIKQKILNFEHALVHDIHLAELQFIDIGMHYSKTESASTFKRWLNSLKNRASPYPELNWSDFNKIITNMEQELLSYKRRSLARRLFKR